MISSLDIAKEFNKRHAHVTRDIKKVARNTGLCYDYSEYFDVYGRKQKQIILTEELAEAVRKQYFGIRFGLSAAEKIALDTIEQLLNIKLKRQYPILGYRIDGYDPVNNVAYEIDEPEHKYKITQDIERQKQIEKELGCKFVRIKV
ncbi:hypothetical protein [Escherichia phage vB_ESM-pEJ01]|nr:hypothetical protein [Escherichia phage vB_ESM-pEJ01]